MDLAKPRLHSKRHQLFQNKWTGTAAVCISRGHHAWSRSVNLLGFLAFVPLSVGGSGAVLLSVPSEQQSQSKTEK